MELRALIQEDFKAWVKFADDASVLIRHVPQAEIVEIYNKATSTVIDGPTHREQIEHTEAARLLGRAAVRGWRGLTMEGNDYIYSVESADFLMLNWSQFSSFVAEACVDVGRLSKTKEDELTKKS